MFSSFADTPVGRLINNVSSGSLLKKPDQEASFKLPSSLLTEQSIKSDEHTLCTPPSEKENEQQISSPESKIEEEDVEANLSGGNDIARVLSNGASIIREKSRNLVKPLPQVQVNDKDTIVVDWYGDDDPENPVNWSKAKKILVTVCINILTFSVYAGSSIATPGIEGMIKEYNVSLTKGTMTLSVFIMGYAVGPLILAPPSDMPSIGRSTPYWTSMLALVLFNVGAAHAQSYGTHITMRLLAGMAGSPALATGGATLGDVWQNLALPKAISVWGEFYREVLLKS